MHSILSDDLMGPSKLIFVCELLYVVTTTTTKLSIGVYFLWLFSKFYQIRIIYPFHRLQTDFYDLRMVYAGYYDLHQKGTKNNATNILTRIITVALSS